MQHAIILSHYLSLTHTQCWQSGVRTTDYTPSLYVILCPDITCSLSSLHLPLYVCVSLSLSFLSLIYVLQLNHVASPPAWLQFPLNWYHQRRGERLGCWRFTHTHTHTHITATQWVDRCDRTIKQFVIEVIWFKILSISLDRPVRCVYVCVRDKTMKMAERI